MVAESGPAALDHVQLARLGLLRAGEGCVISPLAVFIAADGEGVTRPVELGDGCQVGAFAVICGGTRIGDGARLENRSSPAGRSRGTPSGTSTPVRAGAAGRRCRRMQRA
jgi:acetyltransferase-like isoleucine patch superfamily enzyme